MTPPPWTELVPGPSSSGGPCPRGPVPVRAPGVELLGQLTGSGYRRTPGLVRRFDGQTLQLTPLLYSLLGAVDGRRDSAALARVVGEQTGMLLEADDVEFLVEDRLRPLGVLLDAAGQAPEVRKANPLLALKWKFVITNPVVTRRITAPFAALFQPLIVLPVLAAFVYTCWWVLFDRGLASATHDAIYDPPLLLTVFGLTLLSAAFHEFGHAAACRYGGATPGAMGGGLYLVWPAFYTDVDDSYRLSRWGRLRVDLGGLYFNALFAVVMAGLAWATGRDALLLVVVTQLLQMVRQLAPFMRADGYHIIADLTGVPDLFAHLKPVLTGLWPTRWGRPEGRVLRPWARVVVTTWVLVVVPMLLGLLAFGVWILPRLAATAWDSGRIIVGRLREHVLSAEVLDALVALLSLVSLLLPVVAITYLLGRIVHRTVPKVWHATEERPAARAAAVLAGALIVALVAWTWWPSGQYDPVRGDERGTLPSIVLPAPETDRPFIQLPGVTARPAVALVPRVSPGQPQPPTVLVTRPEHGGVMETLVTTTPADDVAPEIGGTVPVLPPPEAAERDNLAIAINNTDGSILYDVAFALVWVTDGEDTENRNEAWALAHCTDCKTVAVAFQVVLIVGQSDTIIPRNIAVAGNHTCESCITHAIAVQLVATLNALPGPEVEQQLAQAWAQLDVLRATIETKSVEEIYATLLSIERTILSVLAGGSPNPDADAAPRTGTTTATQDASAQQTGEGTTSYVEPAPTASSSTSSPSPTASPKPSPSPTSTSGTTTSPAPSPTVTSTGTTTTTTTTTTEPATTQETAEPVTETSIDSETTAVEPSS
jgi:putative peptide zinc metalloprotease protein